MIYNSVNEFLPQFQKTLSNSMECIITSHSNTDLDGFASVLGIESWINKFFPHCTTSPLFPEINVSVQKYIESILTNDFHLNNIREYSNHPDLIIIVDTSDPERSLNDLDFPSDVLEKIPIIIIDHHLIPTKLDSHISMGVILDKRTSTAEIITEIIQLTDHSPKDYPFELLMQGIISDTGHFKHANAHTFQICAYLTQIHPMNIGTIFQQLKTTPTHSERIALIKAAKRIQTINEINGYIILISHLSSYEANAANKFLSIGADVAYIINFTSKKGDFRISGRASHEVITKQSFHLGKIMEMIGTHFSGSGGGHDGAAGCYGILKTYDKRKKEKNVKEISQIILNITRNEIKQLTMKREE